MHVVTFAAVLGTLLAVHPFGDYWVQTHAQASGKGDRVMVRPWRETGSMIGWRRWARINGRGWYLVCCHVATYTATVAIALGLLHWRLGLQYDGGQLLAGLAVTAVSHAFVDRRRPLEVMARLLRKDPTWLHEHGGLAHLDQSWHLAFALITALVIA